MSLKPPKLREEDRVEIEDQSLETWIAFIKKHDLKADQIQRRFAKRNLATLAIYLGVDNSPDVAEGELAERLEAAIAGE